MRAVSHFVAAGGLVFCWVAGAHGVALGGQKGYEPSKGCTRYGGGCTPQPPDEFPPLILPPWDISVNNCLHISEKLHLNKTEQLCCDEADAQRKCCGHCYDPSKYGDQTAFKERDQEKCKRAEDKGTLEHCEHEREKARQQLEEYLHGAGRRHSSTDKHHQYT